jgi:hypothetical protein
MVGPVRIEVLGSVEIYDDDGPARRAIDPSTA